MSDYLIECRGLYKSYGLRPALSGVDLEVGPGRIVGLLGPNGSGKTTLIKLLCGLLRPTTGWLAIDGEAVGPYTKSVVSYLPDRMYFADWMKAVDLFDLFRDFYADFDYQKGVPPLTLPRDSVGDDCIRCPRVYPANLRFGLDALYSKEI